MERGRNIHRWARLMFEVLDVEVAYVKRYFVWTLLLLNRAVCCAFQERQPVPV